MNPSFAQTNYTQFADTLIWLQDLADKQQLSHFTKPRQKVLRAAYVNIRHPHMLTVW